MGQYQFRCEYHDPAAFSPHAVRSADLAAGKCTCLEFQMYKLPSPANMRWPLIRYVYYYHWNYSFTAIVIF